MKVLELAEYAHRLKPIRSGTFKLWLNAIETIKDKEVSEVDKALVTRYKMERLKPWGTWSESTLKMRLGSVQAIWNIAIEEELLTVNPWLGAGKRYKKRRRKYPQRGWEFFSSFHDDPLFLGYWYHGCRLGELAGLTKEELHFDAPIPYIQFKHNSIRTLKNEWSVRDIPIHPACIQALKQLPPHDTSMSYQPGDMWSRKLKRHTGDCAHSLRSNFINRMRQAGVEYTIAMSIVGHEPLGMTATYGEVTLADMQKELQKLR